MVVILGEDDGGGGGSVVDKGVLGFGAKKREITCCFCLPMFVAVVVVVVGVTPVVVGL